MGVGNMSQYLSSGVLVHLFRTANFSKPGTLAVALATGTLLGTYRGDLGGLEVPNAGSYARVAVNPLDANWAGITYVNGSGMTSNVSAINFTAATAPWGGVQITDVAICDSSTWNGGSMLFFGKLQVPKTIGTGDTFTFGVNNLQVLLD